VRQSSVSSRVRVDHLSVKIPVLLFFLCVLLPLSAVPPASAMVPPLTNPPVAAFSYDFLHVAGPGGEFTRTLTVDASASSDPDGISSYRWDWGDGTQDTSSDPYNMHSYSSGGEYQVTLTVTDTTGQSASISKMVTAPTTRVTIPLAAFTYTTSADFVANLPTFTFDASGSSDSDGISSYGWDWGDGTQDTGPSPLTSHTFSSAGQYQVTLTVTDTTGQSGSISKMVTVSSAKTVPTTPVTQIPTGIPLDPLVPILALVAGAFIIFRR